MGLKRLIHFLGNVVTPAKLEEELTNLASQAAKEQKGVTDTFTTADSPAKLIKVENGIIVSIK